MTTLLFLLLNLAVVIHILQSVTTKLFSFLISSSMIRQLLLVIFLMLAVDQELRGGFILIPEEQDPIKFAEAWCKLGLPDFFSEMFIQVYTSIKRLVVLKEVCVTALTFL